MVQAIETGILLNQSIRFWSRAENEPRIIRAMVVFVSVVALSVQLITDAGPLLIRLTGHKRSLLSTTLGDWWF